MKARASDDSNVVTMRIYPAARARPRDVKDHGHGIRHRDFVDRAFSAANAAPVHSYRVYREEIEPVSADPRQTFRKAGNEIARSTLLGATAATHYQDSQFEFGRTYVYSVRSVAQYGSDAVESGQPESSLATVSRRATFFPRPLPQAWKPPSSLQPRGPLPTSNCRGRSVLRGTWRAIRLPERGRRFARRAHQHGNLAQSDVS